MNRTILTVAGVLSASSLLLVDSAVKATVLLALAAVVALILRRDSAATRHLVWLLAIVAMLVVPVLSAMLPQWRVLPAWMSSPRPDVADVISPSIGKSIGGVIESPRTVEPVEVEPPIATVDQRFSALPDPQPALMTPTSGPAPTVRSWNWINALPLVWVIGFAVLMLRLSAARWMLWNSERLATVVWPSSVGHVSQRANADAEVVSTLETCSTSHDPIVMAMETICSQLGIGHPVTLLIHPNKTIPVVWGIFRCRLMLPAAARLWSDEQLQSVLLHELAHIKRRDTIVQLLTQVACALHWFNPLVWFAAWRLDVERERSCDDLVLASGIRPSAYAGHLLDVVTGLSPARWTQGCGLAMARKSSLEGRLTAVLGKDLNRRGVSVALAGLALAIAVGIAVPIAMLRAADEVPTPNNTGKLAPETIAKLKWGEPVNGLRMALAYPPALGDALLGKKPHFELVVQNVSEKEIHFLASDEAPNPRELNFRADNRTVAVFADEETAKAEWHLQPGHCGVLRMFTKEEGGDDGKTVSAAIEGDLSKIDRNQAVAEMEVVKAPEGAWTGKLITGQTRGSADVAAAPAPMHKDARALYEIWQRYARSNGDIPGAMVGELAAAVKQFIKYNPTWETVPKLNELLPRLDATHDWKPAAVIALLEELAAVEDSPLSMAIGKGTRHTIRDGEALPEKYAKVRWGDNLPGGTSQLQALHAAWVLEPDAVEHRIGEALKARLLVHNPRRFPVVVQVPTFHQGAVRARDAKHAEVEVAGISWTTLAQLVPVRLGPGEYIEISTPGVGLGPRAGMGPWAGPRVGSNVLAKPGDELTLTLGLVPPAQQLQRPKSILLGNERTFVLGFVPLDGSEVGVSEDDPHVSGPGWWLAHIKTRLNRELPLPADAAERTRLLDRAVRELFAIAPTAEETAEFIADKTPDALDALAKRLAARDDALEFSGTLQTAPVEFRVIAADPDADKQPRVVLGPGEYPLPSASADRGDATLKIVGRPVGDRRTNEAQLLFEPVEFTGILPPDPHKLEVPDGWGTWAIVCRPDSDFFYLLSKGTVRKIDYSKPRNVTDTPANDLPAEFRDEVKRQFEIAGVPAEQQAEVFEKPAPPATTPDADAGKPATKPPGANIMKVPDVQYVESGTSADKLTGQGIVWNEAQNGLSLGYRIIGDEWRILGKNVKVELWVQNPGDKDVKFQLNMRPDIGLRIKLKGQNGGEQESYTVPTDVPAFGEHRFLPPGHALKVKEFTVSMLWPESDPSSIKDHSFLVAPGAHEFHCELDLPGISATGEGGKQLTPAEGEWTGKLTTRSLNVTVIAPDAPAPKAAEPSTRADDSTLKPKHEYAQSLFRKWQASARTDGKIPGALIGHVAREMDNFLKRYPADEKAPQLAALRPRCDASHDWTLAEVVALLDDITAISTAPVSWAAIPMESSEMWKVRKGEPLPIELRSSAWGAPAENGLRAAWLLEPRAEQYPLGTVLKARVLFHNTGTKPVVFKTETWHQDDPHTARNAEGGVINVDSTFYTGETPMATYRLEQGEYVAVLGHGIGIGAGPYIEERSTGSIGAWIEAKKGDEVSFSSLVDANREGWTGLDDPKDPIELWKLVVLKRVEREAPLPATAADREQLIRHVTRDLFGESPTVEEIAIFTADNAPDAIGKLAARLQAKPRVEPFSGKLPTGETKFRVIAADPNAAKSPRTANSPGRYVLGDGVHLLLSQLTEGDNRTNKATIAFLSPDPKVASPHTPYEIALPDGIGTYGIVWDRGSGALWVMQKGMVRKYEFANPSSVQEMKIEPGDILNIPAHLQEPMKKAFDVPGAPVQQQMPVKPATAGMLQLPKLPDDAYARLGFHFQKFREEDAKRPGGELMGAVLEPSKPEDRDKEPLVLGVRTTSDAKWHIGGTAKVGLVVRNRSDGIGRNQPGSDVKFSYTGGLDSGLSVVAVDEAGKEHEATIAYFDGKLTFQQMLLPVAHVATIKEFTIRFDAEKRGVSEPHVAGFHLPPGKYKLRCKWNDARREVAHEGEWSGELVNEELEFTLAAAAEPAAETPKSGTRIQPATEQKLKWGEPVKGLRMALAWPPTLGEPGLGDVPEFYLVVQNVSKKAVRLTANDAAPNPRMLNLFDATIVSRTVDDVPIPGDWLLQPHEAAFVRLFHAEQKFEDGRTISVLKENVVSTLGQYRYTAEMSIGKAPAGAWTGKLETGATRGSADMLGAGKPIDLRSAPPMTWGVPKDGLRGAWRIIDELRTGEEAKAELWVWNASISEVKLSWTERTDIGLGIMMSGGTIPTREESVTRDKKDFQMHYLVLPAGQAVKLKEFAVRLGGAPKDVPAGTFSLPLTPGDWTLQAKWSDSRHIVAPQEWHGVLVSGELKLKVTAEGATVAAAAAVKAKWPPVRQKTEWSDEFLAHSKAVAEARGTPDAKPDDLIAWGAEENGLRAGLLMAPRVTLGGQLPTRMVLRNVTNDVRDLGLSLSLNRLTASAQTPDGKSLQVHKTQLRGTDALYKVTLMPGEQVEFEGPPVQFGAEHDGETKKVKMPEYPICGVETGEGKVHVHFKVEATTGEAVVEVVAADAGEDAGKSKGKTAAKLDPGTEAQLDWGDAVNGLRAAVVVRSPQPGAAPGIFLAVQNVSAAALRFTDSMAAKEQRKLYLSDSAGILMALTSGEPTKTDAVLPPRGVLFLPMFPSDLEKKGEAGLIEGIRKDSLQTWRAVLNIENAPEGAWKGKLTIAETRGAVSADGPQPKTEAARALFKFWQRSARLNGDIPGGLLARLHDKVQEFIRNNTGDAAGDPYAKKLAPLEPRFGPAGDWKPADVVALLDDITAVTTVPLDTTMKHLSQHTLQHGQPLPATMEKADWGKPLAGGLRMACLLEPRAAEYHLGTEVKARILLHNSGKEAVAFITRSFHQPGHKALLADGSELKLDATDWLTRSVPQAWRLAPGEYIEVNTPGLGIGAHDKERAEWSDVRAGSWILCKEGDEVTFLPGAVMLTSKETPIDPDWWLKFITERLEREAPVPLDTKEREYLLYRVVRELFGTAPSTTEGDAFAADKSPDALKNLAVLLTKHKYGTRCEGSISAGETKFRVLPPDPDADKKPRVAMNPGRYTLGGSTTLVVTRRPDGRRIVNEAHLSYNSPPEEGIPAPHHKIELPDGYDTWAVGCVRGETVLWLSQKGRLLKIDFTNFGKIQETLYEGEKTATAPIPADIHEALRAALTVPDAPKQIHEPLKPAAATPASPAASAPALEAPKTEKPKDGAAPDAAKRIPPATEQKLKWGEAVNGLRAALVMRPVLDEPDAEDKNDIFLVVQNVTKTEVWLHASDAAPNPRQLIWREKGILETINETARSIPADFQLQPGEVAFFRMTHPPAKPGGRNEGSVIAASIHHDPTFDLTGMMEIEKAPAEAWTGKLLSGEIKGGTAIPGFSPAENQGPASDAGAPPKNGDNVVPGAEKPKGAAVKLTPDALLGFWRGQMDGKDLMLSFHRPPVETDAQLDIYFGEAMVAVAIVLLAKSPLLVSGIVTAGVFMYLIAFCVSNPQHRLATSALVASMTLPYVWIVDYDELGRILPDLLVMFAGLPAFLPAALLGRLFNQNMHDAFWLALLLTALEMVIGIWMIRLGPKRTIAYLLLVLHVSALGSLGFHTLVLT